MDDENEVRELSAEEIQQIYDRVKAEEDSFSEKEAIEYGEVTVAEFDDSTLDATVPVLVGENIEVVDALGQVNCLSWLCAFVYSTYYPPHAEKGITQLRTQDTRPRSCGNLILESSGACSMWSMWEDYRESCRKSL